MQTVKGIIVISAIILLVIFGYKACIWFTTDTKLKADNINLFSSENDLVEK